MNILTLKDKSYIPYIIALIFFLLAFLVYFLTQPKIESPFNYFIYLSEAFLSGRLNVVDTPFYFEELINKNGKFYTIYPPMPALLLIPFVAIWGKVFSQVIASLILGAVNVSLVYLLMRRLTEKLDIQIWMTVLFGFGTIYWYTACMGSVWYLAHIASLFFLILAIYETFGARRPFLIGLLLGASYWSRIPY